MNVSAVFRWNIGWREQVREKNPVKPQLQVTVASPLADQVDFAVPFAE